MTTSQRQYALLAVLGIVLVVVWTGVIGGDDPAESARQPSNRTARRAADAARDAKVPVEDVALERLKAQRDALQPTERNPFRFRPKPAPPPPAVVRAPQPIRPPVAAGPLLPPPVPPITLKYIGFADEAGPRARLGVFSDGRGTVINASEGDILEGRYRVLRVGTDSADLVYLDGRGRQTIRLSGQ
jgi:hypothetical protein